MIIFHIIKRLKINFMTSNSTTSFRTDQKKILIAGLGNTLLGDEGVGVKIIESLEKRVHLPQNISLLDGGTAGYTLIDCMKDYEKVILIDAVRGGARPGTVYRLSFDDIIRRPELKLSGHQIDLPEVLMLAKQLGELPQIVLIGIEPENMEYGMELSLKVSRATREVMEEIFRLI
ncbi:MAG: HyaD/HybD family hydrogenase maturation endopeptidase [Deltaproteobacteria bacterium]|nr:HyaD/HybD family hydrogenase maturation endopeptidase [Deltaproteobacteria bacterium]